MKQEIGSKKKQTEIITEEEEELLWGKGVLADGTPQRLMNTTVFYNGYTEAKCIYRQLRTQSWSD